MSLKNQYSAIRKKCKILLILSFVFSYIAVGYPAGYSNDDINKLKNDLLLQFVKMIYTLVLVRYARNIRLLK